MNVSMDKLIENEPVINEELKELYKLFKKEKTDFPFGNLCILHYREYTDSFSEEIYSIAAAIELIILSFDIVDDLQDNDTNNIWVNNPAFSLNVVLIMLTLALKSIRKTSFSYKERALNKIESCVLNSVNGQHIDLLNQCKEELSYLKMIGQKSGALVTMSCMVGIILATGEESKEVEIYSNAIGIIQQIKNDITGLKDLNYRNDLVNKKYSLPIIYLFASDTNDSLKLKEYFDDKRPILDISTLQNSLVNSGAIRYALTIKNLYKSQILNSLCSLKIGEQMKDYIIKITK